MFLKMYKGIMTKGWFTSSILYVFISGIKPVKSMCLTLQQVPASEESWDNFYTWSIGCDLGSWGIQGFQSFFAEPGSSLWEQHLCCVQPTASDPKQLLFQTGGDWDMNCTKMQFQLQWAIKCSRLAQINAIICCSRLVQTGT